MQYTMSSFSPLLGEDAAGHYDEVPRDDERYFDVAPRQPIYDLVDDSARRRPRHELPVQIADDVNLEAVNIGPYMTVRTARPGGEPVYASAGATQPDPEYMRVGDDADVEDVLGQLQDLGDQRGPTGRKTSYHLATGGSGSGSLSREPPRLPTYEQSTSAAAAAAVAGRGTQRSVDYEEAAMAEADPTYDTADRRRASGASSSIAPSSSRQYENVGSRSDSVNTQSTRAYDRGRGGDDGSSSRHDEQARPGRPQADSFASSRTYDHADDASRS